MEDKELKQLVADTGRILSEKGLVARTWGNISVRKDADKFAISPSGLGYDNMQAEDVPIYDAKEETWEGSRKPSSEKKIHAAAYQMFPDVNFVIHTHQDYATAVGICGTKNLNMSKEEEELLGRIEIADYGLPGTGKLKNNVIAAYEKGSKVVLMLHHGAVILGTDKDDAIKKAQVLEEVCKRAVEAEFTDTLPNVVHSELSVEMKAACKDLVVVSSDNLLFAAAKGGIKAQLDDVAQMLGYKLKTVANDDAKILKALNKQDAVLVKGVGCLIFTENADDAEALKMLTEKAAMTYRYSLNRGVKKTLSQFDCVLMHFVYKKKYSKKKEG